MSKNKPRRRDLPAELHEREARLRNVIRHLEDVFPGSGIMVMVFDTNTTEGHMSYISNCKRADMIKALEDQLARFRMGTEDTAGREA